MAGEGLGMTVSLSVFPQPVSLAGRLKNQVSDVTEWRMGGAAC